MHFGSNPNDNSTYLEGFNAAGTGSANAFYITGQYTSDLPIFQVNASKVSFDGNVGIGTTAPGTNAPSGVSGTFLEVNGNVMLTQGGSGKLVFPDGTTQTTAFIPANCGADYAESVGVSGDRTAYEPGDILVIDPTAPGKFLKSNQAYSTLVAGIYST